VPCFQKGARHLRALRKVPHQALKLGNGAAVIFDTVERFSEIILRRVSHITRWGLREIGVKALCGQIKFAPLVVPKGGLVESFGLGRAWGSRRRVSSRRVSFRRTRNGSLTGS